jgi:hypothetical protein
MLPADMIVMCLGTKSVDSLVPALRAAGMREVLIGDALKPRKVTEAVAEGALAVLDLLGAGLEAPLRAELHPLLRGSILQNSDRAAEFDHA